MGIRDWWDKLTNRNTSKSNDVIDWMAHWLFGDTTSDNGSPIDPVDEDYAKEDVLPYIPGGQQAQALTDTQRYWDDYEKNTGKHRLYPGMQTHSPDVGDIISGFNWWLD